MSRNRAESAPLAQKMPAASASLSLLMPQADSIASSPACSSADKGGRRLPMKVWFLAKGGSMQIRSMLSLSSRRSRLRLSAMNRLRLRGCSVAEPIAVVISAIPAVRWGNYRSASIRSRATVASRCIASGTMMRFTTWPATKLSSVHNR